MLLDLYKLGLENKNFNIQNNEKAIDNLSKRY